MAAAVALPALVQDGAPQQLATLIEGLLEVLARVLISRPGALQTLLPADAAVHARFMDAWLANASARYACI